MVERLGRKAEPLSPAAPAVREGGVAAVPTARVAVVVRGAVQGVGFRPFVHRLAVERGIVGWVSNDGRGVRIEAEGPRPALDAFVARLRTDAPRRASVHEVDVAEVATQGTPGFEIRASLPGAARTVVVLADGAVCADCLAEVLDPRARRHRHPFANCTQCGPRFSIVTALPYDRANTTMRGFPPCAACRAEYLDPDDRRFHAEPIACPACGPRLELLDGAGTRLADGDAALVAAARAIAAGSIVAVKGLGGFQLMADARDDAALARLRARKRREAKPLAVMVRDLQAARALAEVSPAAERLLASPEAPIVLCPRRAGTALSRLVAPGVRDVGVMLPTTPLHHLLLRELEAPVVATSGNRTDEPIATENDEARDRLGDLAGRFLVHDRPIARHVDDSVVALLGDDPVPLRRARGYAPMPVRVGRRLPVVLALGGHLKVTVALSVDDQVFVSQHVGDLDAPEARVAFDRVVADLLDLYAVTPVRIAHDLHPDYASTRRLEALSSRSGPLARLAGVPRVAVQHHHAHLASCLAENGARGEALGVTWDGTGHGSDGTAWGGEFLFGDERAFRRVGTLRSFPLLGGDAAAREPRRSALALLHAVLGEAAFDALPAGEVSAAERPVLARMLATGVSSPPTTSAGRLFDGVAGILGIRSRATYEGEAAMLLEAAVDPAARGAYDLPLARGEDDLLRLDWRATIAGVLEDRRRGVDAGVVAARFHHALAEGVVRVAEAVGAARVALSGGCFQNRVLLGGARDRLVARGFEVFVHRQVPANDGGLSLGQVVVAAARAEEG